MARNLRDKLRLIIEDAYDLQQETVLTKLEALVKEELALREEERLFDYQDLCYIKSVATQEFVNLRHDQGSLGRLFQEPESVRILCIINATVGFLRQKGLLPAIIRYKK